MLWRLAAAFVVLTLIALVLVPWAVQRRVTSLRAEIVASEPARTLVIRWGFSLVRQLSAFRDMERDAGLSHERAYRIARQEEDSVIRSLIPMAVQLGPEVVEALDRARSDARDWHEGAAARMASFDGGDRIADDNQRPQELNEQARASVAALDSTILRATETARERIGAAEQRGLAITLVLGILALLAAAAAIALQTALGRAAREAERRRLESAEALANATRASEARTSLLRGITHDVKNPLGAARGYAELLNMEVKAPLAPEQIPMVQGIQRSIDGALHIIEDLLDLARLESGGLRVERVQTDLNALVKEGVSDHQGAAQSEGHSIVAATAPAPILVYTDPARVRQIMDNLISNAIKYTPSPGSIVVGAEKVIDKTSESGTWAAIRVSDTGPGIPSDQREAIFDEFSRLDEGSASKGHGLGLAIARGIARRLDGDLYVADNSGEGATFVLRLPLRK